MMNMIKTLFLYGTDDLVSARRLNLTIWGRRVWESADKWYVEIMIAGNQYFMRLIDFVECEGKRGD